MASLGDFLKSALFGIPFYRYLIAFLIILLSVLLQKIFYKCIKKLIQSFFKKYNVAFEDSSLQKMGMPVKLLFFVLGIWIAYLCLDLPDSVDVYAVRIIRSLFTILVFLAVSRLLNILLEFLLKRALKTESKTDDLLLPVLFKGLTAVLAVIALVLVVQEWDYNITALLTGLGLGGLAFALAAQDTLANLFGSVMIMIDRPFLVGDWILTASAEGTVEEVGFRSTKIRTFAQAVVSIPNSTLSKEPVTNWSRMGKRLVTFRLGLVYSTSAEQIGAFVRSARQLLENNRDISEGAYVYFDAFGGGALEVLFHFYTHTTKWDKYLEIREQINLQLMALLKETGISLAYPGRSVYLENVKNMSVETDG